jgi:DmsE family decaheme c-type cytochrome
MRSDRVQVAFGRFAAVALVFAFQAILQAQEAKPAPPEYVGSETCQACHEDIFTAFGKNPHHVVGTEKKFGRIGQACESCHGPGGKHAESTSAEDIRNPAKLSASQTDQMCLTCHLNQPTHSGRLQGGHAKGQVSCIGCHTMHGSSSELRPRRRPEINAQCSTCHVSAWAQFQQPNAHRLPQGAMSCVDCHNPHGTIRPQMLRTFAGNEPGCLQCHTDKRGPFAFEHAPMRLEGCGTCHQPHGSPNPRMLTRHEVRFVCLECHANLGLGAATGGGQILGGVPPSFHDLRSARFQNCTICHQKVHGTHVNRTLLR